MNDLFHDKAHIHTHTNTHTHINTHQYYFLYFYLIFLFHFYCILFLNCIGLIHSDLRNCLKDDIIEAKMMISFNNKQLANTAQITYPSDICEIEISLNDDDDTLIEEENLTVSDSASSSSSSSSSSSLSSRHLIEAESTASDELIARLLAGNRGRKRKAAEGDS